MSASQRADLRRIHLVWGWGALALWTIGGLALEALHGFKVGWLLDADAETRRMLFRLAHAHGALTGLLNLAFGLTFAELGWGARGPARASRLLRGGTVLLAGGFLLGGVWIYDGDPGLGIVAAPVGGLLLCAAMALTARAALRRSPTRSQPQSSSDTTSTSSASMPKN